MNEEIKIEPPKDSEDAFENWVAEEYDEESHTSEGVYLGDGIYA